MCGKCRVYRLAWLPMILALLAAAGCAANYVSSDFDKRVSRATKATGLIIRIDSVGLEQGGLKHRPLAADEVAVFVAMHNMKQLFSPQALQRLGTPELHLPQELRKLGYSKEEAGHDTELLTALFKTALGSPRRAVTGEQLAAVRRLASRTGGDIILLGEIHTRIHTSEKSRSIANLLTIIAAAGGQYGVTGGHDSARSKWVVVDPADGRILRTLSDTVRLP